MSPLTPQALSVENKPIQAHRWLIVLAVMLAAFIEVLDMTIVNVAMPQMMGTLQADANQITWVLTSYIVSSAIVMLLTGFLVTRFGRRKLLLTNIIGFLLFSVMCGLSQNLIQMVLFRTLQGIFGASLIPLSQFILRDTFDKEEQGMAMAIWGTGIMVAPVLGPVFGGYLTEHFDWRWVFYINIPICLLSLGIAMRVISESVTQKIKLDWLGMLLMAVGVGSLQLLLDRGNIEGWLESNQIKSLIVICIISLSWFIYRGIVNPKNIVNLRIFRDRGLSASTLMLTVFGIGMFGTLAVQPLMLENLMQYPAITAGMLMAPRGIVSAIFMFATGLLMTKKIDPRVWVLLGVLLSAYGAWMMSQFSIYVDYQTMLWPMLVQGAGMGLFFVPLSAMAMATVPEAEIPEATGLFSFGRNLGSSIGISILGTILTRETQTNWHNIGGHLQTSNPNFIIWLQQHHTSINNPVTIKQLSFMLNSQAAMISYLDVFWFVTLSFIVTLPLILALKPTRQMSMLH